MKIRLLTILAILLLPFVCYAQQPEDNLPETVQIAGLTVINIGGGVTAAGCGDANCPSGAYLSRWDGDYLSDTDKICYNSCASSKDGAQLGAVTISTDCGRTGNGVCLDTIDEGLYWTISSSDILNSNVGTICLDFYLDAEAWTNQNTLFEFHDGDNSEVINVFTYTGPTLRASNYAGDTIGSVSTSTTFSPQTWHTMKYTWDGPNGDHKICLDGAGCDEDLDEISAPANDYTTVLIGERWTGAMTHAYKIDNVRIYSTYDATCGD